MCVVFCGQGVSVHFREDKMTIPTPVNQKIDEKTDERAVTGRVLQSLLGLNTVSEQFRAILTGDDFKAVLASALGDASSGFVSGFQAVLETDSFREVMSSAVSGGIKKILDDEDLFKIIVAIVADSLYNLCRRLVSESTVQEQMETVLTRVLANENTKGSLADGVYHGVVRLTSDEKAKSGLATVGEMVVLSPRVSGVVNGAIDTVAARIREFMVSETFMSKLEGVVQKGVAGVQELINLSFQERIEDLKKIKLTGTFVAANE